LPTPPSEAGPVLVDDEVSSVPVVPPDMAPVEPLAVPPLLPGSGDGPGGLPCRVVPVGLPVPVSDGFPVPVVPPDVPVALPVSPGDPLVPVAPVAPGPLAAPVPAVPPGAAPGVPPDVSLGSVGIGLGVWLLLWSRSLRHAPPIVAATTNAERKIQRVMKSSCPDRRARAMHGRPDLMFGIAAIGGSWFTRAAATARVGAPGEPESCPDGCCADVSVCSSAAWPPVATRCRSRDRCGMDAHASSTSGTGHDSEIGRLTVILPMRNLSSSLAPSSVAHAAALC
jgi:hypothetical protein